MDKISVCIPTYNRHQALKNILEGYIKNKAYKFTSINILDDCPEALNEDLNNGKLKISYKRNIKNIGYASSFCSLFESTNAEYLIFSSDDDDINFRNINELIENDLIDESFACFSTNFYKDDEIYRGRYNFSDILIREIRSASNHAPGLIYKKSDTIEYIKFLKKRISSGCYFTQTYPQVVLFYICFFNQKKLAWLPINIVSAGFELESKLKISGDYSYSHPISRIEEFKSFASLLDDFKDYVHLNHNNIIWAIILHRISFLRFIIAPYSQTNAKKYFKKYKGVIFYLKCFFFGIYNYLLVIKISFSYFFWVVYSKIK